MPIYKPVVNPESIRRLVEKTTIGELDIPGFQKEFVGQRNR